MLHLLCDGLLAFRSEIIQYRTQVLWQRHAELDLFSGAGQPEADPFGVEEHAGTAHGCLAAGAVDFVADDGMLGVRQVDANLVGAAGERMACQPSETFARRRNSEGIQCHVPRGGRPAPTLRHRHALTVARSRPIGALISPCAGDNKPYTSAQ